MSPARQVSLSGGRARWQSGIRAGIRSSEHGPADLIQSREPPQGPCVRQKFTKSSVSYPAHRQFLPIPFRIGGVARIGHRTGIAGSELEGCILQSSIVKTARHFGWHICLSWSKTHGLGEEKQVHQDQRIGLALAVLLIGAAGAFFFRNDPKPAGSGPRLKSGRELDARIAEKSVAPYLQNGDEDHEVPRSTVRKANGRAKSDSNVGSSLPNLDAPDFLRQDGRQPGKNGVPPQSSDTANDGLAPIPFPDLNDGGSRASREAGERSATSNAAERIHVVQKGETLSSIAAKELGSSNRFQDVFEANRDQLNDANDVRVGMSLRIPARRVGQSATAKAKDRSSPAAPPLLPAESSRGEADNSPAVGADPDAQPGKKKFEPVKRPPLGVKGLGTQSSEVQPPSKPIRKLSQLPPKDAGGKVAR